MSAKSVLLGIFFLTAGLSTAEAQTLSPNTGCSSELSYFNIDASDLLTAVGEIKQSISSDPKAQPYFNISKFISTSEVASRSARRLKQCLESDQLDQADREYLKKLVHEIPYIEYPSYIASGYLRDEIAEVYLRKGLHDLMSKPYLDGLASILPK